MGGYPLFCLQGHWVLADLYRICARFDFHVNWGSMDCQSHALILCQCQWKLLESDLHRFIRLRGLLVEMILFPQIIRHQYLEWLTNRQEQYCPLFRKVNLCLYFYEQVPAQGGIWAFRYHRNEWVTHPTPVSTDIWVVHE